MSEIVMISSTLRYIIEPLIIIIINFLDQMKFATAILSVVSVAMAEETAENKSGLQHVHYDDDHYAHMAYGHDQYDYGHGVYGHGQAHGVDRHYGDGEAERGYGHHPADREPVHHAHTVAPGGYATKEYRYGHRAVPMGDYHYNEASNETKDNEYMVHDWDQYSPYHGIHNVDTRFGEGMQHMHGVDYEHGWDRAPAVATETEGYESPHGYLGVDPPMDQPRKDHHLIHCDEPKTAATDFQAGVFAAMD